MSKGLLVAALALATAIIPVNLASSAPDASRSHLPERVAPGTRMLLTFDNGESLRPGTRVRDDSGHRHHGRVVVQAGGELHRDAGLVRRGADFPAACGRCGRAIIEVADGRGLDPRRRAFTFGVAVKVTPREGARGSNLVQKGFFRQAGGQYKLQLAPSGAPSCVIYGSAGRVRVTADRDVTNGRWHRLSCSRVQDRVSLRIDGRVRAAETGATGAVRNASTVRVGGKKINPANKQFHGDLDSVSLRTLTG